MSRPLYEITDAIEVICAQQVDHETGVPTDEASAALDDLAIAKEEKVLNIARYLLGEEAEAGMVQQQIDRLAQRKRRHEARAKWLRNYLEGNLQAGAEKYRDAVATVGWRKSQRVEVVDADAVPKEFLRVIPATTEIDKQAAKPVLKGGASIMGLELVTRHSLQVK